MGIRPIVSTVNSVTANLAEFLDIIIPTTNNETITGLPQGHHTVCERNIRDPNTWLVTVDVKSLYTNIPNEEGIQACYEAWRTRETMDPQHPPVDVLRHLLETQHL